MACKYTVGGREDATLDRTLKYVEETTPENRSKEDVAKFLEDNDIVSKVDESLFVIEDSLTRERINTLNNINTGARDYFGVNSNLLTIEKQGTMYKVDVNQGVLNRMKADPDAPFRSGNVAQGGEQVSEEEKQPEVQEETEESVYIEESKRRIKETTELLVVNLRKQIDRLSKLPESDLTKAKLAEMEVLKRELKRIDLTEANLDDYMDFVDFAVRTSQRAERLINKIVDNYDPNATQEERTTALKELAELKKTIDAFYNNDNTRSLLYQLSDAVQELEDNEQDIDETVVLLQEATSRMRAANERFLESGLEIQVDYLLEFAPPEINQELDSRIAGIRKNRRIDGLNRFDKRYIKARRKGIDEVLKLNITQLQEKKIGRDSILKELKQTHRDRNAWSVYFSPAVYSRESSIQLFAESVRKALVNANEETLEFKYDVLAPAFRAFKEWKMSTSNVTEDNLPKLYEDIVETIVVTTLDENGDPVEVEVASFVQEFDMTKFNRAKSAAFQKIRSDYNFPTDPSEYEDYFKTDAGKAYLAATAKWYSDNTESIEGAEGIVTALRAERDQVFEEIQRIKGEGHSDRLSALYLQYNDLKYQLLKSYRNGQYIGKLSKPKKSLYNNPKFDRMPAEARTYYNLLLDQYKKDQKRLGRSALRRNSFDDFSYILPSVRKEGYDRLRENGLPSSIKDIADDSVNQQETDTEFGALIDANGDRIRMIPQYFTNMVQAKDVSLDVTNSAMKFHDMANRYKAKSDILGVVMMMEAALASRKRLTMTPSGDFIVDSTALKEGYNSEQFAAEDDVQSGSFQQVKSFIDNVIYGMNERQSLDSRFDRLSANKISNSVVSLTAYSTLSLNWLQAGNQYLLDRMTGTQEGVAGDYYSLADLAKARAKMSLLGGGMLGMLNDKFLPKFGKKNKLAKFLESVDAFQSFGNEFGKEAGTALKKGMSRDSLMVMQQTAEMMTVAERALAMAYATAGELKDKNGKVILNEQGKPANLYELMKENSKGRLVLDPRVATTGKYAFDKAKFIAKLHGMMKRTNQLKGNFDRVQAQRSAFGKLLTLFRNYLVPGLRKRFGNFDGAMIDVEMAAVNEGYYATIVNQMVNAALDLREGKIAGAVGRLRPGVFKRTKQLDRTQANIRRAYFEFVSSAVLFTIANSLMDYMDDEEEETYAGHFATYQLLRLSNEWSQFRSPALFDVIQDPTAVANPIVHLAEAIHQSFIHFGYYSGYPGIEEKDVFYQRRASGFEKGDPKLLKEWLDFIPTVRGPWTAMDPERASQYYKRR
tara:strand:+ start:6741 stop:10577 length:3837 start_codon:yes stop_codon:yes gene_type:complete